MQCWMVVRPVLLENGKYLNTDKHLGKNNYWYFWKDVDEKSLKKTIIKVAHN